MRVTFQAGGRTAALACFALLCLTACGGIGGSAAPTTQTIVTLTTVPTVTSIAPTPSETPEVTPEGPLILSVWWPEPLAPISNDDAALLLTDQVDGYELTQPDVRVEIRLKKPNDVGGIMDTLRAAYQVAPDALPDLTLMRRDDLLEAVKDKLIQPVSGTVLSTIRTDLYPAALELGLVNRQLYGLPYVLDIEHIAYRPVLLGGSFARFASVLSENQKFIFPAGIASDSNNMLLLQYLSAGGTLTQINAAKLDINALQTVYTFYQDALAKGIFDASVLNYVSPDDYQAALIDGQINAALVTSNEYLDLLRRGQDLSAAPLPLAAGDPTTIVNGWMWVVVTKDSERQAAALRFLEWMLDVNRQTAYTEAINVLPSRRATMQQWSNSDYGQFTNTLLLNARIPIALEDNSVVLQAMQSALAAVISGQRTAEQAAQDVVNQVEK